MDLSRSDQARSGIWKLGNDAAEDRGRRWTVKCNIEAGSRRGLAIMVRNMVFAKHKHSPSSELGQVNRYKEAIHSLLTLAIRVRSIEEKTRNFVRET